jgi:hypothetical protein
MGESSGAKDPGITSSELRLEGYQLKLARAVAAIW